MSPLNLKSIKTNTEGSLLPNMKKAEVTKHTMNNVEYKKKCIPERKAPARSPIDEKCTTHGWTGHASFHMSTFYSLLKDICYDDNHSILQCLLSDGTLDIIIALRDLKAHDEDSLMDEPSLLQCIKPDGGLVVLQSR